MKTKRTAKMLVITSVILLVGGSIAFAHGGWGGGYNRHMGAYGDHMMGPGYGGGHMMDKGPGWGKGRGYANLSEEDAAKVNAERERFYTETKELRRDIRDMRIDLRDEMRKDNPDAAKAAKTQKELSKLQGEFDQKAVKHRLEMHKLVPEKFQGRGYGRGYGRGQGRGFGAGGHCWE